MRLLRFLFRDLHIKLIALVVATMVWAYAVLDRTHTLSMTLPVTAGKVPPGMVVANLDTGPVVTRLSGKGRDLLLLRLRKPAFRINVTSETPGRSRVKLTREQSNLPGSVELVSARPEFVNLDLDQQARRPVRVLVPTRGRPANGFVMTSVRAQENVTLLGPQDDIGLVADVRTETLTLNGLDAPAQRRLRVLPPEGRNFGVDPESVTVMVRVEKEATREFANVTLTVIKPSSHIVTVKPPAARITVSGADEAVRKLTVQDIAATMKITDTVTRGRHQLPCEIALPPGVTLVSCDPVRFDVEVK